MSWREAEKIRDRIEAERWIRSTFNGDPEYDEKKAAYDASMEWVGRGYIDPRVSFEAGAAWHRTRHNPLCACGETLPGPCIRRYPEGHNSIKCGSINERSER